MQQSNKRINFINQLSFLQNKMAVTQTRPKRKPTGGRYGQLYRKKKQYETGGVPAMTRLEDLRKRKIRTLGGKYKEKILSINNVNLMTKEGKCTQAKIITVKENPANRHFVRRNILTKGTIIDTDKGKAKITSRPGQEGAINAVQI
jgi:small subunit ribosomal protein S8e